MKLIKTEEALGHILCHDMTQIIPGVSCGPRFRKGHVVEAEDIPVLLSMGKEHLYVWECDENMVHENDAALRLADLIAGEGCEKSEPKEGKVKISATHDGVLLIDSERFLAINSLDEIMAASRKGNFPVKKGDYLCGTRVIPLVVEEERVARAEALKNDTDIMRVAPYKLKRAAIITTGSEVYKGLIEDKFTPVVQAKLAEFGVEMVHHTYVDDAMEHLVDAIAEARSLDVDFIICTGGMSVDPDDNTPGAISRSGARIVTYGAPVLPGAMFVLGYFDDETPIVGLPGCVMYSGRTIFDLVLPRICAGIKLEKRDFVEFGEGGLCLNCDVCTYPVCPFGK